MDGGAFCCGGDDDDAGRHSDDGDVEFDLTASPSVDDLDDEKYLWR